MKSGIVIYNHVQNSMYTGMGYSICVEASDRFSTADIDFIPCTTLAEQKVQKGFWNLFLNFAQILWIGFKYQI